MSHYSRRHFLRHGLKLAGLGMVGQSLPLSVMYSSSVDAAQDYKAIVCVLLAGGADSFNVLVPRSDVAYAQYQTRRSDLALNKSDLLPLDGIANNTSFGLHPALAGLQSRFNSGTAACVANIGPLLSPTDRIAYDSSSVALPLGLFSHADQITSWQTATPDTRSGTGFGGRLGDYLRATNTGIELAGNISVSGNNLFQSGQNVGAYSINAAAGVRTIGGYTDNPLFKAALDHLIAYDSKSPLQKVYASKLRSAIDTGQIISDVLAQAPDLTTPFAGDNFSVSMARIAQIISMRQQLGVTRQTFFVTYGGWDHHDNLLSEQAEMLPSLDAGLSQFATAMEELGVSTAVTAFTVSDFGRTLTSNGKGSDHGWGGNSIVLGGAVQGGQIYGEFPELVEDNPLDVGRGRFIPTTAVDGLYAEIARWMGVAETDLAQVLPNWDNFAGSTQVTSLDGLLV